MPPHTAAQIAGESVHHVMSPTGVATMALIGLVVDWTGVGPNSLRDRFAFMCYLAAARDGWNGSSLDQWTVQQLKHGIGWLLHRSGSAYIAGASAAVLASVVVGVLGIYALACWVPEKFIPKSWSGKAIGTVIQLNFPSTAMKRLNFKLMILALAMGMLADLGRGVIGTLELRLVVANLNLMSPLPNLLFGAS